MRSITLSTSSSRLGRAFFYCLVSTELAWRAQRVIASFSSSELSPHQIPRSLGSEGPLQLKGCTRTSCLFSPTTPSGASVLNALFSHSALHVDFGVEQACSAAARVLLALPISRGSPSPCSSSLSRGLPPADPRSCGSALPSSGPTSSFPSSSTRVKYLLGGGRMCFPVRDCRCLPESHCIFHRSCSLVLRCLFLPGRPDVFFLAATADDFKSTAAWLYSVDFYQIKLCEHGMVGHCFRGTWTWTPSYVGRPAAHGVVHGCRTFPGVKCLRGLLLQLFWAGTNTGCVVCCLGSPQSFEGTLGSPQNHSEHGLDGHCFRGQWVLSHWFVRFCIHSLRVSSLHVSFMDF